ncbi:MAG: FHA domain-containing protein [Nitrospiraceae bacterium]
MPHTGATFPRLIVKSPRGMTKEIEIGKPSFTIGRKADNDLCLDDPAISGHHARIVKIQEVLFLEDLASTNGTLINERKVDRKQLQDADIIKIGFYRIIYRHDIESAELPFPSSAAPGTDKTVLFTGSVEPDRSRSSQSVAVVRVLSGKTDHPEYQLSKQLSVIGSQENAAIRLTGWFAPKTAAIIGRRANRYVITMAEGGKQIYVNEQPVKGQASLADGDVIEVAGVKLYISLREAAI